MSKEKLTREQRDLVESHLGLAYTLANKYTRLNKDKMIIKGITNDDLVQEGVVELCKSSKSFDESVAKFSTYSYKWIEWGIRKYLNEYNIVKIPDRRCWSNDTNKDNIRELTSIESSGVGSLNLPTVNDGEEGETIDFIKDEDDSYEYSNTFAQLEHHLEQDEMALVGYLYNDYTNATISKIIRMSEGTVRNRINDLKDRITCLMSECKIEFD